MTGYTGISLDKKIVFISMMQWFLLLVLLTYLFWVMPKGFDTFDEGIALLHANPDQLQIYQPIQPGPLLNLFVNYDSSTVLSYRWLRFWLLLVCTIFLGLSIFVWANNYANLAWMKSPYGISVIPCLLISGFISYVNAPFSIHYNHLVYCLIAVIIGVVLLDSGKYRAQSFFWVLCGILSVLLAYIKWPSAIAIVFVALIYRLLLTREYIIPVFISLLAGFFAGLIIQDILQESFISEGIQNTRLLLDYTETIAKGGIADSVSSLKDVSATDSYIFTVLKNYILDAREIVFYLLTGRSLAIIFIAVVIVLFATRIPSNLSDRVAKIFTLLASSLLVVLLVLESTRHPYSLIYASVLVALVASLIIKLSVSSIRQEQRRIPTVAFLLPIIMAILSVIGIFLQGFNHAYYSKYIFISMFVVLGLLMSMFWRSIMAVLRSISFKYMLVVLLLFISPFCIAFGHDGGFVVHLMYGLPFWVVSLILVASLYFSPEDDCDGVKCQRIAVSMTTLVLSFLIVLQVTYNSMLNPYHTYTLLHEQKYPIQNLPKMAGIELDPINQKYFSDLGLFSNKARDMGLGRPTLVVGSMPGMVYAMSSYSPGHLWYTDNMKFGFGNHNARGNMCDNFVNAVNVYGPPDVLIPEMLTGSSELEACLDRIDFPDGFIHIGSAVWYDYRRKIESKINYYIPKS